MRRHVRKRKVLRYLIGFFIAIVLICLPAAAQFGGIAGLYAFVCMQIQGTRETVAESAVILPAPENTNTVTESAYIGKTTHSPQDSPAEGYSPISAPTPVSESVPSGYTPEIVNHTNYSVDPSALFDADGLRLELDGTPEILIVHTHSSESFTSDAENPYLPDDVMRTLDTKYNVVRLGDEISAALEAAGIGVLHDREINDYPSYNGSYSQMLKRVYQYLADYPTIKMVIDVHRDAVLDADGNNLALRTEIDGEECARLMFVVGTDAGGLSHPGWRDNLSFAATMQGWGESLYPGLMRSIDLRQERFNQHTTAASVILEIGSAGNTLTEALRGAACFTQILLHTLGIS